jgi:hypothetical protein
MPSKYEPRAQFLDRSATALRRMTFVEIERVLGFQLPASARRHAAWWSNTQLLGQTVQSSGWQIQAVDLNASAVTFVRTTRHRVTPQQPTNTASATRRSRTASEPFDPASSAAPAPALLDVHTIMDLVAKDRPVFHSEADFQHAFAWIVRQAHPSARIRLETRPLRSMRLDVAITLGDTRIAVELKYPVRRIDTVIDNETYQLPDQSAHDITRHDITKDIWRIEQLVTGGHADEGWAITLTNDPAYWKPPTRPNPIDAEFRIHEAATLTGTRRWLTHAGPGTTKGRAAPIDLLGTYTCRWDDFASPLPHLGFRWLAIHVPATITADRADADRTAPDPAPGTHPIDPHHGEPHA